MGTQALYQQRLQRILTAIALGKPDRVPVVPAIIGFAAQQAGVTMAEFLSTPERTHEFMFQAYTSLGEIDGVHETIFTPAVLSALWLSRVKVPGVELKQNELWQVCEEELMTVEDYDTIINAGLGPFLGEYFTNRLDNLGAKLAAFGPLAPGAEQRFKEAGLVSLQGNAFSIPFEMFCGGRSMAKFSRDLFKMPDRVQAAMDVAMEGMLAMAEQQMAATRPFAVWVGGWRSASEFLSPRLWERFVWPYYKRMVEKVVEAGVVPLLHLDSNWERDLPFFLELPKAKCIFATDGSTDIFKIKEVLGDHMCIQGDVGASLLALGSPDDVYAHCRRMIQEIGPSGFILSSGCDIPPNAKFENVKSMVAAAQG
ncbi:MAG: uroD [Holophagaceae bacterium]|nr:uroD [Holophagaceae bacterium]